MPYDETEAVPLSEPATENATKFHIQDVPAAQRRRLYKGAINLEERWRRFYGHNTGLWNGNWGDNKRLRQKDNREMFDAIAGYLELSRHQRDRALYLLHGIHFPTYSPYYTVRDIIIIVCILVASVDYRGEGMIYYPTRKYPSDSTEDDLLEPQDPFRNLIESLGVEKRVLEKGIPKFRNILNNNRPAFSPPI
ncbi:hypothetical protein [Salinilacihabitans rarus]|uniref:hypothetical protein n=1 Tax=Salinilacihabitans rarus TaxID=2961596 RepID=UPI0020C8959E|nr:hypothetical protein [Salinilacihabitans rarus]